MTRANEPAWTFYGRQECGCCEEAANLLLRLLEHHPITVRMIDLHGPEEAATSVHRLPALLDAHGQVIWQGSFDSAATQRAWDQAAWANRPHRPRAEGEIVLDLELAEPSPNGLQ